MINEVISTIKIFSSFMASEEMLLICALAGISIKSYLLYFSSKYAINSKQFNAAFFTFLLIIIGTILEDAAWALKLLRTLKYLDNYCLVIFSIRMAWVFCIIHYQALINFSNLLIPFSYKNIFLNILAKISEYTVLTISTACSLIFLFLAFFKYHLTAQPRFQFDFVPFKLIDINNEIDLIHSVYWYLIAITFINFLLLAWKLYFANNKQIKVPSLVRKQVKILAIGIIAPRLFSEFIQAYQFSYHKNATLVQPLYCLSCILSIVMFYFCIKRILGLRLLNFSSQINLSNKSKFIDELKISLEQLNNIKSINELDYIIQRLFEKSFEISPEDSLLYIRPQILEQSTRKNQSADKIVEMLLLITEQQIINYEEIEFNNFYNKQPNHDTILKCMESLNIALFVPIKHQETILGAIAIKGNYSKIFSKNEHEEIVMFVRYLANTINTIKQTNLDRLVNKCKKIEEELYQKHHEIRQYKESLRTLLKNNQDKSIAVLYYKNRKFVFANQAAKNMLTFNINKYDGHPFAKVLRQIAQQVEQYKSSQIKYYQDPIDNKKYVISALPHLEQNNIIVTINYAEATDIIKEQISNLKNATDWDYLLYLETTQSGIFINNLIPGNSETLINFKIDLLKLSLTKKSILISSNPEDTSLLIDLIHNISLKENINNFEVRRNLSNEQIKKIIFGSKQLLDETIGIINTSGTLVINNIELLPLDIQDELAETIKYGTFYPYKSNFPEQTEARIIFTTQEFPEKLLEDSLISSKLYKELQTTTIEFPTLSLLRDEELIDLAKSIADKNNNLESIGGMFELSSKDKERLINRKPESLTKLTQMITELINKRILVLEPEKNIDPAYDISDQKVIEAARLGKRALKDPDLMLALWKTFKNQNQIADFLKVNRSSVNRRCREFKIV